MATALIIGAALGGALGLSQGSAQATVETPIYRYPTLSGHTAYGIGMLTGFKNSVSCNYGPPFAASVFLKTSGGNIYHRVDANCPLSRTSPEHATNWWCSNRTPYSQLGICFFSRNV